MRAKTRRRTVAQAIVLAFAATSALTGCSGTAVEQDAAPRRAACVDDSKHCIAERATALQAMLSDRERRWVREPASAQAYASGVRMFAFKQRKKDLSCDELAIARREADAAPSTLRGSGSQGLSPAHASRGAMFAAEVGKEISAEQKRRCKA